jgi:hypothetical protein
MKLNWCKPFFMTLVLVAARSAFSQESEDPKLIEAARREGKIVWYTTMSTDHSKQFADRFHQRYPFVEPVVAAVRWREFAQPGAIIEAMLANTNGM